MSLYADYCNEKRMLVAENEKGFMTAYTHGETCLVDNFYVVPKYRGTSVALRLTMAIIKQARELGCKTFCAEIYKSDPLYDYILRLHKHFGMDVEIDTEFKTVTAKSIEAIPC